MPELTLDLRNEAPASDAGVAAADATPADGGKLAPAIEGSCREIKARVRAYAQVFALAHAGARILELEKNPLRVFVAQLGAPDAILTSYPNLHVHVPLYERGEASRPSRVFSFSESVYTYEPGEASSVAASIRSSPFLSDFSRF